MSRWGWWVVSGIIALYAQSEAQPAFEVASIRPHTAPLNKIFTFSSSGPRATLEGYLPVHLVLEAYHLRDYQVAFSPSIPQDDRTYYDVVAKAPGEASPSRDEFRRMLQSLLVDRFRFQSHREMREIAVYALVVGNRGPKFKESPADVEHFGHYGVHGRNQTIELKKGTMAEIATDLVQSFAVDRPVVDQTGLTGGYDIKFEATREGSRNPELSDVSVFTAVQEQLGLKLEPRKLPLEVLIVDRMDKPTAN